MALSGGGFRAASYSIGALGYLDYLKYKNEQDNDCSLLENVEFISSASGGSFAGMLYSAYVKQGKSFKDAYKKIMSFMNGQQLLQDVLALINKDSEWEGYEKSRNFINAFARIYDERLFDGETFGVYWKPDRNIEVCINATEFYRGISFRFQTDGRQPENGSYDTEKTGNAFIFFDTRTTNNLHTLKQIKLGDILAASSCFPAGFEPIIYPYDFSYNGLDRSALEQAMLITDYNGTAEKRMMKVIACGQFTTCAKLLEYALATERLLQLQTNWPPEKRTLDFSDLSLRQFKEIRQKLEAIVFYRVC